ncbi:MAG: shikimate dehydrogenase [Bacteroidota bacterium]|nr:shikimate dehydrogenase [Bacteroidota bacterium]
MRTFGIIGFPLSHSFSQKYFTQKILDEYIQDALFVNFPIPAIENLPKLLKSVSNLRGLAVTIPYKKQVLPYLQDFTNEVKQIGACNCIKVTENKLYGYNTDVVGFEKSFITHLQPHHTNALILGSGGAAVAVEFVLNKLGIVYQIVSRTGTSDGRMRYEDLDEEVMKQYNVIINCTPLGTFPKVEEAPPIPYHLLTAKHYLFDLVYNPPLTKFLSLGNERGAVVKNGYDMLTIQAEENWKIWNENV